MLTQAKTYPDSKVIYPHNTDIILISDITILERGRKDLGDISLLAESIRDLGLITPICLSQEMELLAGERRLRAHEFLNLTHISYVIRETLTPSQKTEIELEENIARKQMEWMESCLLIDKVHQLRVKESKDGTLDLRSLAILEESGAPVWGQRQTGEQMGVAYGQVSYCLLIAKHIRANDDEILSSPSLKSALDIITKRKEDEINSILANSPRTIILPGINTKTNELHVGPLGGAATNILAKPGEASEQTSITNIPISSMFRLGKVEDILPTFPDAYFDHIITDPPYAIEMKYIEDNIGVNSDIKSTHVVSENLELLEWFIKSSYAKVKDQGFMFLWCDPMQFRQLHDWGLAAGWRVQRWPLIWHKLSACKNQAPHQNTTKDFEIVIKMRKGNASLTTAGPSSIITSDNPDAKVYDNPFAKPFKVWEWLITMCANRNSIIGDFFGGNFSLARAAINLGHNPISCEVSETHYNKGLMDIKEYYKIKHQGAVEFN